MYQGSSGSGRAVLSVQRFAGIATKCLHRDCFAHHAIAPRLPLAAEVVVRFVERAFFVAGQGQVQLAIREGVFREFKQLLRHALSIDRPDRATDARLDLGSVPDSLPVRSSRLTLPFLGRSANHGRAVHEETQQGHRSGFRALHGMLLGTKVGWDSVPTGSGRSANRVADGVLILTLQTGNS